MELEMIVSSTIKCKIGYKGFGILIMNQNFPQPYVVIREATKEEHQAQNLGPLHPNSVYFYEVSTD